MENNKIMVDMIVDEIKQLRKEELKAILRGDIDKSDMCDKKIKELQDKYWSQKKNK